MTELHRARVNTAGAYICFEGLFIFAIGTQPHNGRIPVIRLGGHREAHETGWECAVREIREETGLQINPLIPVRTYLLPDGDGDKGELELIRWHPETVRDPTPVLVVAYQREGKVLLSLMYLAQINGFPAPSAEIKGLLLLQMGDVHRLCQEQITLGRYLDSGGKAILNHQFNEDLILEPFLQLRLLSRILLTGELLTNVG